MALPRMKPTPEQAAAYHQWCDDRDEISGRIAAFETLYGVPRRHLATQASEVHAAASDDLAAAVVDGNMTAAIEIIASEAEKRMSHKEMRGILRGLGFEEDRLGNYYYTAVHRLKGKGRISVDDNGIGKMVA